MDEDAPDVVALGRAFLGRLQEVSTEFRTAFAAQTEDLQYRLDKAFAKELAKHPELYADLRRGVRQARRAFDDIASHFRSDKSG